MTEAQKHTIRASEIRQRLNQIAGLSDDEMSDEVRAECDTLTTEYRTVETRLRAAITAQGETVETGPTTQDAEHREREELRQRSSFGRYLSAALRGRQVDGPEAEYAAAVGVNESGRVPLGLFEAGEIEHRADTVSPAPSTVGVNLQTIVPAVFALSVAPRLGITMPTVQSGTYSVPRITTSLKASTKAKGDAAESTAAALTVIDAKPRRISARLSLTAEDVASVGTASFESALRQNLQAVMSEAYDLQCLAGDAIAPNIRGFLTQLTAPDAPDAIATFDDFAAAPAGAIDGLWASEVSHVAIVAGVKAYRLSASTFRGTDGEMSAASYLARETGGWWTNARMPAAPTSGAGANVEAAIVHRRGRTGLTTAEHPTWDSIAIDDIYSDSGSATRHFSLHVLVGHEVLIVQPGAYGRIAYKVA